MNKLRRFCLGLCLRFANRLTVGDDKVKLVTNSKSEFINSLSPAAKRKAEYQKRFYTAYLNACKDAWKEDTSKSPLKTVVLKIPLDFELLKHSDFEPAFATKRAPKRPGSFARTEPDARVSVEDTGEGDDD